jgi:hypothetical protein
LHEITAITAKLCERKIMGKEKASSSLWNIQTPEGRIDLKESTTERKKTNTEMAR